MSSAEVSRELLATPTGAYDKFRELLAELFMFNEPELDFGIYRIMGAKRDEISRFLDYDLLPQVKEALGTLNADRRAELERVLEQAVNSATQLGITPDTSPKVQELRRHLAETSVDGVEGEIFSYLYNFFRRYYDSGDFIAQRRYKPGVYAIPYEGEEVKLHWATRDQHYIKTTEQLRDYDFRLRPEDARRPMRVHFRLVDAAEDEHGDVKSRQDQERVFILASEDFISESRGELTILFAYRPAAKSDWPAESRDDNKRPPTQKDLISIAAKRILSVSDSALRPWIAELGKRHQSSEGQAAEYTRLEVQLKRYTARNTFDYFIHKDLGAFLRREFDFFVKNEIVHLDDIDTQTASAVGSYLAKVKAIRRIAGKVIDFLAQLEDFEKKLWLKKKFVVETYYCIAVSQIPETFYPEIATNDEQRKEWNRLLAIEEIRGDLSKPGYSVPLTSEFLKAYPSLMVDTRYFSSDFGDRLISTISNLDEITDGVLVQSENLQALSLLRERYRDKIDCIHIDPPYNTQTSGFLYKNDYQHSSWLSMMAERLVAGQPLLISSDGNLLCHIDENEQERLHGLCDELRFANAGTIIWDKKNPMLGRKGVATQHEYILWRTELQAPVYLRSANQRLILETAKQIIAKHRGVTDQVRDEYAKWISNYPGLSGGERAYRLISPDGRVYQSAGMGAPEQRTDPKFFVPLIHPTTGKPCPVPPSGWSRAPETIKTLLDNDEIIFGADETVQPRRKLFLSEDSKRQVSSVIQDASRGKADMDSLGLEFPYCHPLSLYVELVGAAAPRRDAIVLDFFAGSGTNGHAVIVLNRDEGTRRRFILVEVREYFDTVLLPRIKKAAFTPEWKNGKPHRLPTNDEIEYGPRLLKILRLEAYEDTLNNLELRRSAAQQNLLDAPNTQGPDGMKEQYVLQYMLDIEARDSQSLLNIGAFADPFRYTLKVKRPGGDETLPANVDLVETFNYLIGLRVKQVVITDGFTTVTGSNPEGKSVLIIWRNTAKKSNAALDDFFRKHGYAGQGFDIVYVNGDNNLENLRRATETWHIRLTEEHFQRLMFGADVQG